MNNKTAYQILGVDSFTSQKEIRKKYLTLCKLHHPDIAKTKTIDFREITAAYEWLSNKTQQQHYSEPRRSPINTLLWTRRSYFAGLGLAAFTLLYFYQDTTPKRTTTTNSYKQIKSDIPPWEAAGLSFREWQKR
ncbi:uncharacterized protein B0P05DRAFT_555376 [Gilbertella persicaria]|uniref:uncharacterized protein n=1 Tax=Gilbertella persicaria TaxID=101096 RepID=UPI00222099CD|nr:uncharacterized protein B0P05DRAFT_555376 [Gilbertella persicaria]KAI8063706.1 hypothetical protein B0P05DRAFT_555376 [Gilbertella persicaria]